MATASVPSPITSHNFVIPHGNNERVCTEMQQTYCTENASTTLRIRGQRPPVQCFALSPIPGGCHGPARDEIVAGRDCPS